MKQFAVIPAYEPDARLIQVVQQAHGAGFQCLIVNDGSDTSYDPIFEAATPWATICGYEHNQGKGHALKYGFAWLQEHYGISGFTVTCIDADCQHSIADAVRITKAAASHPEALCVGSRLNGSKARIEALVGRFVSNTVFAAATGVNLKDTLSGLRAFDASFIPLLLAAEGKRYEYETNVLLTLARQGITILEYPISTTQNVSPRKRHFNNITDVVRIGLELAKFGGSSLICTAIDLALFQLIVGLFPADLAWANIAARIASASLNFSINRRRVFGVGEKMGTSLAKYALLALFILACSTMAITWVTSHWETGPLIAKMIVDGALFFVNWTIQRTFIFKKQPNQN